MTNKKLPNTVHPAIPHPEEVLERLLDRQNPHRSRIRIRKNLEILHHVCRTQFEAGNLDFSARTLAPVSGARGGPTRDQQAMYKHPYRDLMLAWAAFAGGNTLSARTHHKRERELQETINYLDDWFRNHGRLPTFDMIKQAGTPVFIESSSAVHRWVQISIKAWQQKRLANVSHKVIATCDRLFNLTTSLPLAAAVHEALKEEDFEIDGGKLSIAIEQWRECRFAIELWKFAPSTDESDFMWLALHPELAEWRPMLIDYLASLASVNLKRHVNLALQVFFVDYLLAHRLPLTPQSFLRSGYTPPSMIDVCMKHLSPREIEKRWRRSNALLEHVLDRADEFVTVDGHGHRLRKPQYRNTLPPLTYQADVAPQTKIRRSLPSRSLQDPELSIITELNPQLEQWRVYAVGWLAAAKANLGGTQTAIRQLIFDYIVGQRLPSDPSVLLSKEWQQQNKLPSYYELGVGTMCAKHAIPQFAKAIEFIDYVLQTHYSAEDDYGRRTVSGDYHNFLLDQTCDLPRDTFQRTHSNKDVLPSRYIRYLRELICPDGSTHFSDLAWARDAVAIGDWFEVNPDIIDKQDPDCVWRERMTYAKEGRKQGTKRERIYEMWSPVRAIATMLKLELPLRTYQVRMLDSGEADTWRYEGSVLEKNRRGEWTYRAGEFRKNSGALGSYVGKTERHAGVFRRMPDALSGNVFAGLYINTNKTQDRNKEKWDRGYVVPWQHGKILYWCERLRNWQQKYNSVDGPIPCTELPEKVFGKKSDLQKQQMGSMCFLFRDPVELPLQTAWPITDAKVGVLWEKMLEKLEEICVEKGHRAVDGSRLRFVSVDKRADVSVLYPLHSLRVSLITHLATEGGVEMHILSECIAGHARILMTLYYKKSGVVYVSEAMDAASERLRDDTVEQQNWVRWMKEASLKQIEVNSATVDLSVLQAVKDAFGKGGSRLLRTNLGLCAKGGMECDNGGIIVDDNTGAVSYGPAPGYPQQKNCVRCRWFLTGPAFLQALVHHWNLLHFNLGDTGHRYLEISAEVAELESAMLDCQRLNVSFEHEAQLENLRHALSVVYDGNEKLAADSLATMKLIVRCKQIVDAAKDHNSGVILIAVGGMQEVTINVRECSELEQVLTAALGSTIYVDEDLHKAVLKAGNAFDRMLAMNGKDPVFFKLSETELPAVVSHMTRLLQAYTGSIGRAVPFVEGSELLSALGLFGETDEILRLASAGTPLHLNGSDERGPILVSNEHKVIPIKLISETVTQDD